MLSKRETNHQQLTIQVPELMNSVASQGSISNFVAQTPKENRLVMNFKRATNLNKANDQKENTQTAANNPLLEIPKKNQLPYKMVTSELPAPCSNHEDKESSFYIESQDGELIFYCEKCAILVASQGFQVKKIESNLKERIGNSNVTQGGSVRFSIKDTKTVKKSKVQSITKQQKQTELTNFLNNLERIQSRIDKAFQSNESSLVQIDSAFESESTKIKDLFSGLHKVLDDFQERYLQELQNKCISLRQPIQAVAQQLNNDTSTFESMKEDICQAYDDIINQTTGTEFQTVMNAYKQNTAEIELALAQNSPQHTPLGGHRKHLEVQIEGEEIIRELQKQIVSRVESIRRQSIKSTKGNRPSFPLSDRNVQAQVKQQRVLRLL